MNQQDAERGETEPKSDERAMRRAAVREHLIDVLLQLALPRKLTREDYTALADPLAYLSDDALRGLADYCLIYAGGGVRPVPGVGKAPCAPPPAMVRAWARAWEPPPPRENTYVVSVMQSRLGERAFEEGWFVELYRYLLRHGAPPPSDYTQAQLVREFEDNARVRARIRERLEAGQAIAEDQSILSGYSRHAEAAAQLVREGIAKRAAQVAA